ncbi:phage holin family protein [Irregularibacter muris]|uniref:Phage holin family protein n=1 Tax=Irregularibacter muris TaxID=1796619 RepID=A0AAE3L369_9FIRM|nr:phage holin family protein [Irregularibacter muris]MCR1897738.1 phage holin family protein [Irregularibacter muris]
MARKKRGSSILAKWLVGAVSLYIVSYLMEGISITGFTGALWAAGILGFINLLIKPIIVFFTLPITIITLGLFMFVINGIVLLLAGALSSSIYVAGLGTAIIGSLIMSIINSILLKVLD